MRISELLGAPVHDPDGESVGKVVDVRLVQDGPLQFPYGAALRLDGFIVAERTPMRLLGYERDVRPAVFRFLVRALAGTVRFVSYDGSERLEDGSLRTRDRRSQLPVLDDVPARREPID